MAHEVLIEYPCEGVGLIKLNRPTALNAISIALEDQLRAAIAQLEGDSKVKAIVLTGEGRAFSAGVDLKEVGELGFGARRRELGVMSVSEMFERLTTPVIAAVNGFAVTGGFELALMCDLIYASTAAKFADTHARVEVIPGWGLSQRLPWRVGVQRAKEISLSGNYVDAQTAYEWGIVNRVFEPDALLPAAVQLASDIAGCAGPVQSQIKRLIEASANVGLSEGLRAERTLADGHNHGVSANELESRRGAILGRGRDQN